VPRVMRVHGAGAVGAPRSQKIAVSGGDALGEAHAPVGADEIDRLSDLQYR
jgi:hypothetical protein